MPWTPGLTAIPPLHNRTAEGLRHCWLRRAVSFLLYHTGVDEVADEDGGRSVLLGMHSSHAQLGLQLLDAGLLGALLVLAVEIGLLGFLELMLGSSPLAAGLQEMNAGSVLD